MKRENTQLIKDVLQEFIKEERLEDGLQRVRIFGAWDLVVGDAGARATTSKFFRDGILYCTINSSIIRTQLYYRKEEIALKINKMLNDNIVSKIVLK
ncbi:MAG: DUF721 domain-containing protein [Bacteroidales bacterium]|nr:DUF721 domain-containing protein [Bacteroidales bacterium]